MNMKIKKGLTMNLIAGQIIISNLSRFVIIIWIFVVFILQASYTANLTSMLTVQRLTSNINELLNSKGKIAYLADPFKDILLRMQFDESRLISFKLPYSFGEPLMWNHSIDAIVGETLYLEVVRSKYCDNLKIIHLPYRTSGFGFVSCPCSLL